MLALLGLCMIMFLASFGIGIVPLYLQLKDQSLSRLSIAGTGVLISSALAIVIPEGCEAVFSTIESDSSPNTHSNLSRYLGASIVFGFVLMLLIEQSTSHLYAQHNTVSYIAVDNLHELHDHGTNDQNIQESARRGPNSNNSISSTIGLCIHSIADGIALGSSAHTETSLSLIIFFAILLHKGPAAFSLTSILMGKGLSRKLLQLHLLAFSMAAPIGAIITYICIAVLSSADLARGTGLLLSFSGGTFLYVAISHAPQRHMDAPRLLCLLGGFGVPVLVSVMITHDH